MFIVQDSIQEFRCPTFKDRWLYWTYATPEQRSRSATIDELERLQKSFDVKRVFSSN